METRHDEELSFLNQVDKAYDQFQFDDRMRHYMLRTLRPYFLAGQALEMGCFHGEFTTLLAKEYEALTVVDASADFIGITRGRVGDRVRFIEGLFETFETADRYQAIFLMHTLEHLNEPVSVLTRARQLLAPGGRAFLVVPNGNAPSRQIAVKMGLLSHNTALTEADIKHGHRRTYTLDTLERDARAAGFSILQRGGVFFKALANFQFEKLMGGEVISDAYMEGCYQLGMEYPPMCASIYLICEA